MYIYCIGNLTKVYYITSEQNKSIGKSKDLVSSTHTDDKNMRVNNTDRNNRSSSSRKKTTSRRPYFEH